MSRLLQRWRTQRNAIRNVICKTSWIINILNAHCASSSCWKHVPSSVHIPNSKTSFGLMRLALNQSLLWSECVGQC